MFRFSMLERTGGDYTPNPRARRSTVSGHPITIAHTKIAYKSQTKNAYKFPYKFPYKFLRSSIQTQHVFVRKNPSILYTGGIPLPFLVQKLHTNHKLKMHTNSSGRA